MAGGGNHLHVLHAHSAQSAGDELGGAADVGGVIGQGTDAGNAEELLQLVEEARAVRLDKDVGSLRHNLLYVSRYGERYAEVVTI